MRGTPSKSFTKNWRTKQRKMREQIEKEANRPLPIITTPPDPKIEQTLKELRTLSQLSNKKSE